MPGDVSSYNCPHCSRGPGQGHHVDCPTFRIDKIVRQDGMLAKLEALTKAYDELPDPVVTQCEHSPPGTAHALYNVLAAVRDIVEVK